MSMLNKIDNLLNKITMYRLVLYGLFIIVAYAFCVSPTNKLGFTPIQLLASLAVAVTVSWAAHQILRRLFHVSTARESWLITALLLFLILRPDTSLAGLSVIGLAAVIASASKYVITYHDHHIFNPVAFAVLCLALLGSGEIFWWVGSAIMLPVVLLVGLAIVRKTRKGLMSGVLIGTALASAALFSSQMLTTAQFIQFTILSGPLLFFTFIMFSEPLTSPATQRGRIIFALVVGAIYGLDFEIGPINASPEFALIVGNLLTAAYARPQRLRLEFVEYHPVGSRVYEFVFKPSRKPRFKAGQYIELTMPHKNVDKRGNRRFFSIVSAPEDAEIRIAISLDPDHTSSFKRALMGLSAGDVVWGATLGGDFTLPKNEDKQLVFIAGGIGVTPFHSIIQYLVNTGQKRNITLIYMSRNNTGFSYWPTFNKATSIGVRPVYIITGDQVPEDWTGKHGVLDEKMLKEILTLNKDTYVYISGPPAMVRTYKMLVRKVGAKRYHIKTDYFSGY